MVTCFSDTVQLAALCDKLRDTNTIIECAEQEAKTDIQQLENDAKAMKEEAENVPWGGSSCETSG